MNIYSASTVASKFADLNPVNYSVGTYCNKRCTKHARLISTNSSTATAQELWVGKLDHAVQLLCISNVVISQRASRSAAVNNVWNKAVRTHMQWDTPTDSREKKNTSIAGKVTKYSVLHTQEFFDKKILTLSHFEYCFSFRHCYCSDNCHLSCCRWPVEQLDANMSVCFNCSCHLRFCVLQYMAIV